MQTIGHIWILIHNVQYVKRVYPSLPFSNVTLCGPDQRDYCSTHIAQKNQYFSKIVMAY